MKTKMNKEKIIAATTTALLVVSLIGTGIYYRSNAVLKGGLKEEKLKSESLLSEKLVLSKEAEKLRNDIASWKGKSEEADRLLSDALSRINNMESTIKGLRKENATVASLRKELNELKQLRTDLENQLAALEQQNRKNAAEMEAMSAELVALRAERDGLQANLDALTVNVTDNFRVESKKGRKQQKLTVNAARTKALKVSFEIPESMADNLNFRILTPSGSEIKSNDVNLTHRVINDTNTLTASLSPYSGDFEISKRIEMIYTPSQRLSSGLYTIEVMSGYKKAGSVQIRLR